MADISLETVAGKLNRVGYDAFLQSLRHARSEGNRNVELSHWLFHILQNPKSDISVTLDHFRLDRAKAQKDLGTVIEGLRKNATETPQISEQLTDVLDRGWHYATLMFGEAMIRTGHILVAALKNTTLRRDLVQLSKAFAELNVDTLVNEARTAWADSDEDDMRPMDGSGLGQSPGTAAAPGQGSTALGRFAVDMTAQATGGKMDPIVGRDDEIRQIIDILLRRRQNNPILTGEAGVGKTAVVEGFAQRLAANEVPPKLQGTKLFMLDLGLMQAGASMKGEFEQRLRSVIDEVQNSPVPIILFIDEIHTLMGAGGAAGTGDAANLLKPALARGTLRTIGATTWMEYAKYFEKDPAMTRRFQPVMVDEPTIDRACYMLRGILGPMEAHHNIRISDEAVVAAVNLSARYLPARQLPDKAVSLLDTACARVAISQSTVPASIQDSKAKIAGLETELAAKERQADLGEDAGPRVAEIHDLLAKERETLARLEADYAEEKSLVDQLLDLWKQIGLGAKAEGAATPDQVAAEPENLRPQAMESVKRLQARKPDERKIYAHVDAQAVAAVISDWTGIPAGKMVSDELQAMLALAERLKERVIGQDHGLEMIATRVQTASAKLANPNKPIGVFMLCGPSGVGKTETALALAEAVYGGEQNIITINMSEFQEAHTVSLLKGAPPGYVGYGEGGRLTEAVRRKPYSVVLLDEVEKAHSDVHELFFQVFDKGIMEDGSGRQINFKNTLILLTSNVGTDVIMDMADKGETKPDVEVLEEAMKPHLLRVFPPALLGRIVTIPYFPLSTEVLGGITKLKLGAIVKRMKENHGAAMTVSPEVTAYIVEQCRDPDSGGRMVDNIISNTILPALSREVLDRMVKQTPMTKVELVMKDGQIGYDFA
jgi:type VI secretion system protein VasG